MTYASAKTYGHDIGLSACFRQWRATSHCRFLHGYALEVRLVFEAAELDERNWVVDFGELKTFKFWLEDVFDHKTLVAEDDPEMSGFQAMHRAGLIQLVQVPATGCEAFAKLIFDKAAEWLIEHDYAPRVTIAAVEVSEHGANSAIVSA